MDPSTSTIPKNANLVEQYLIFWAGVPGNLGFPVEGNEADSAIANDRFYLQFKPLWKDFIEKLTVAQEACPERMGRFIQGDESYEMANWEMCDSDAEIEVKQGHWCREISFGATSAFSMKGVVALTALVKQAFLEATGSEPVLEVSTYTQYACHETKVFSAQELEAATPSGGSRPRPR